jgi:hypothetical protein
LEGIQIDGGGNADFLPDFLNINNFTPAFHFNRAFRISVFQPNRGRGTN